MFPAGHFTAVVDARKHQDDPCYPFPAALAVKLNRSRWYRFFESENSLADDPEGWEKVLDDRLAFARLMSGLFHYILSGKSEVPGMEESFGDLA